MGGDHKCPVCQATFTRPQHVARHMRSHTGDRPYKCQHCGDQFARSDLLSRHVNKCHANEKPLPNVGITRRKGAVSASRAKTSKQSCDQCVQSSLPCDGCNPCSKCVSRKCRCTYVKFHRQTAPIGPGHNTRSPAPAEPPPGGSLPTSVYSNGGPSRPSYQPSDDEFILGPAPSSVPTMAETLYSSNSFTFPPLYPPNTDMNTLSDSLDYGAKFRTQQAEFFGPGRSGMATGLTPLYDPRHGTSTPNPPWLSGWENQDAQDVFRHSQPQGHRSAELMPVHSPASALHEKHELANHQTAPNFRNLDNPPDNPPIPITMPFPAYVLARAHASSWNQLGQNRKTSPYDSSNSNSRRGSVDFSGSDGASGASGSVPSSANNSNVHLPLGSPEVNPLYSSTGYNLGGNIHARASTSSVSSSQHCPQDDRHEFSSAFGLMSLDDPAVIAGLAVDGRPFFDDPSQAYNRQETTDPEGNHDGLLTTDVGPDNDTPMPLKRDAPHIQHPTIHQRPATSSGAISTPGSFGASFGTGDSPTPSKDADTRELREFWKEYMRTPLSGPQDVGGNIVGPNVTHLKNPSPASYRRQRVASMPSTKTPMVEKEDLFAQHPPGFGYVPTHQPDPRGRPNAAAQQGPTSSLRTTLHVKEDLRSYEAAVLARKAPTLNLQLRRPTKGKNVNHQSSRGDARNISNANPQIGYGSRPPSSSGFPLANAFGEDGSIALSFSGNEESVSPSLSSSRDTPVDTCSTSTSSDVELRPSFKRLASQTLGPENCKRTFFGYNTDGVDDRDKAGWSTTVPEVKRLQQNKLDSGSNTGGAHTDRPVSSIAERRRMSAPSSSVEKVNLKQEAAHPANIRPLGYAPGGEGGGAG